MNLEAYAKINLGLHIVGKRPDGFHNIETIFHHIALHDKITLLLNSNIEISSSNPSIPVNKDNLCWKAVDLLRRELSLTYGAAIHIKKNIPIGAGLGGGSSDAAAVLQHLPSLWNVDVADEVLQRLALQLGSDVPFFLKKSSAYAEGRGEILSYFPFRLPYWIVVVNPNIHVSTPWAYSALAEQRHGTFPQRSKLLKNISEFRLEDILHNDFEEVVFKQHPSIKEVKNNFLKLGAVHALMSGSGSSVFGLFENESTALKAAEFFDKKNFVHMTKPDFSIE
ncbi:MAG: 4-(cytidine 5'-diphospho)-2-C-methyl-D-erythritol kinase [Bacteroidota bacterium]|nr:4-(cytidine 5'-diphospho)-2-C-methyl-D-erythritol kinase [Bacteroidota bacterium]